MKDPYAVILKRHITEKSRVLQQLQTNESNRCVARCKRPKYVFIVDKSATKGEIAEAMEMIYSEQKIKVSAVNTIRMKPKLKRRGKGRKGGTPLFKKAIITLEEGDVIDKV